MNSSKKPLVRRRGRSAAVPAIAGADVTASLDRVSDGLMVLRSDWIITYVNPAGMRLLREHDLVGRRYTDVFPGVENTDFHALYVGAMREQIARTMEGFYAPFDAWFEVNAYPSSAGLTIYFRDVTQRHAYYALLVAENDRFNLVARATRDILFDWHVPQNVVRRNDAVETVLGYSREEQDSSPDWWYGLIHPDDLPGFRGAMRGFADCGGDLLTVEYRARRKDGRWARLMTRASAVRDEEGRAIRVIGAVTDLTRQMDVELRLAESQRRLAVLSAGLLRSQEEERRRIARDLHDQLGQSLTALEYALAAEERRASSRAIREMRSMVAGAIEDVRRLARELRPPLLDDLGLVAALEREVVDFARRTGLVIEIESDPVIELPVDVSIACFRIVQEALTNIARHADAREVTVSIELTGGMLRLDIVDDGCGIDHVQLGKRDSLGIPGMIERARLVGGVLTVRKRRSGGTRVKLHAPLASDEKTGLP